VIVAAAVLAVSMLAAGCGIPTQSDPSAIPASHVPPGLVSPVLPSTTTTQPPQKSQVPVKIFLLGANNRLEPVGRVVLIPAPLSSVITTLVAGPSRAESAQGFTTAIPSDVTVLDAAAHGQLATVDFNLAFEQITGSATELAVAQVVATVVTQTSLGTGVLFEIGGVPTSVPIASGAQVPGPVYLWQFLNGGS
jgi:hypothetical protein